MAETKRIIRFDSGLLRRIIIFSIPIMAMNFLMLLFNAADMVIVGRFAGSDSLAAVGATGALISLLVNSFMGISVGTNVVIARDYGAGNDAEANRALHTSISMSAIIGIVVMAVGIIFCEPVLTAMGTPENIIGLSVLYMKIYFIGIPANMIYNFAAAALRAVGDSKHATIYLIITGSLNIVLNVIFVVFLHMTVDGVAWATVITQYLALILIMAQLIREKGCMKFSVGKLNLNGDKLIAILRIGVPAGLQSVMFSISNVLIQSSINSFGSDLVAGNSAASNIEGFVNTAATALSNAAITFTGQAVGADNYKQIDEITKQCIALVLMSWVVISGVICLFARSLLHLYVSEEAVIEYGLISIYVRMAFHFLTGIMNILPGIMRGMGYSLIPMINTTVFACAMRIVWLATVFKAHHTVFILFLCYPVTWALCAISQSISLIVIRRREFPKHGIALRGKPAIG